MWTDALLKAEPLATHLELLWFFRRRGERTRLAANLRERGLLNQDLQTTFAELASALGGTLDLIRLMANDLLLFDLRKSPMASDAVVLNAQGLL